MFRAASPPGNGIPHDSITETESHLGNWTVALTESRGVGREVGIVGIETDHSRAVLSQVSAVDSYG